MRRILAPFAFLLAASMSAAGEEPVAVPPAPDVEKATKLIRELFKDEFAKTQVKARQALAEKLLKQAEETADDPAARYALYREAADVAASVGDVIPALDALDAIHQKFSGVKLEQDEPTLKALTTKAPQADALVLAGHLLKAVDEAIGDDELGPAERLAALAVTAAARSKNVRLSSLAAGRVKDVEAFKKEAPQVKEALKTLEKAPKDPAAAATAGKYYCFQRGEWEKGLPLLVASTDARLKAVAEKEAAGPKDATELLAVADAWYEIGGGVPAHLKRAALGRALTFYTRAMPDLAGLNRTRTEKRLEELEKVVEGRGQFDELWAAVRTAVRNKDVEELKPVGGAFGDKDWRDSAPNGGVLIGFHYALGKFGNHDVVAYLQPIYTTPMGEKLGAAYGKAPGKPQTIKAKPGYAIGQINFYAGGWLAGYSVTFVRIQGKALNLTDKYESPYVGSKVGGPSAVGDSRPIIGLYGKREAGGDQQITNLGLIVAGPKPPKKP